MNRQQRRAQERAQKKQNRGGTELEVEIMQPWSDILMRVKLPDEIVEGMLDITDQVLQDPDRKNWGDNLAGQIADEPLIPHQMMMDYKISNDGTIFHFLMNIVGEYIKTHTFQQATLTDHDKVRNIKWLTQMKSCWIISQWEG